MNSSSDRNILAEGSDEYGRIARKLRRVSEAFDRRWAPGELPKGVTAKVEELAAEYERIENNRARLSEVKLHYKHNDADGSRA